jgi:hypothetical protein
MQDILRRMQSRLRGNEVEVYVNDLPRIARACAIGRGGFQGRFPLASLREHLASIAPLFADATDRIRLQKSGVWIYFVREIKSIESDPRIKIGQTTNQRKRGGGWRTDNPRPMEVLLWIHPKDGIDDGHYHRRFWQWHSTRPEFDADEPRRKKRKNGEWFWPDEALTRFILEESTKQKLSQRRSCDDARSTCSPISGTTPAEGSDLGTLRW